MAYDLALSGLASGFDWKSVINQLAQVERAPQNLMYQEQGRIEERNNAFTAVKTSLSLLQNRIAELKKASLFDGRTASSSDEELGTVAVTDGAIAGKYRFAVSQLATNSKTTGTSGVGQALSTTDDVSGLLLSSAGLSTAVTAGTFTVNGKQITVDASDTLGAVLARVSEATGGDVTASYSKDTDKITLTSASNIVLGSATDTSNFLHAVRLYGNNGTSLSSASELGSVRTGQTLENANFATAITGGTTGQFKINGVTIDYDATQDTVSDVLARINASGAGVNATYDAANDRFSLVNQETGNTGIALEDVSGNFLAASGLLAGTLDLGKNLEYTVDGGPTLVSRSNTITEATSGIAGLSVTALAEDSFDVTVAVDTETIKKAVTSFVEAYNSAQSQLSTYTASSTDAKGKVTAGVLADDTEAARLISELRGLATTTLSGLSGSITRLDDLGIASNGYDDSLSSDDLEALDTALAENLDALKGFFSDSEFGWAVSFDDYLEKVIGDDGTLVSHQAVLTRQAASITTQIEEQEKWVQAEIERLTASFVAMETAQAQANQQLQYLSKTFASSGS